MLRLSTLTVNVDSGRIMLHKKIGHCNSSFFFPIDTRRSVMLPSSRPLWWRPTGDPHGTPGTNRDFRRAGHSFARVCRRGINARRTNAVRLLHVTCRPYSVIRSGLNPAYSRRPYKAVWLCTVSKLPWVIPHLMATHNRPRHHFCILSVEVPKKWLRRHRRGVYSCTRKIAKRRISLPFLLIEE